jgi:hypothetical protein
MIARPRPATTRRPIRIQLIATVGFIPASSLVVAVTPTTNGQRLHGHRGAKKLKLARAPNQGQVKVFYLTPESVLPAVRRSS